MRVRRFFHLVLVILAALVAWQVVSTWTMSAPEVRELVAQEGVASDRMLPLVQFPAADQGKRMAAVIAEKDLFSSDRGQAGAADVVKAVAAPPSHLKLVGVVRLKGKEEAFFSDAKRAGKVVRVMVGETIDDYRLTRLTGAGAVLTLSDGQEADLPLLVLTGTDAAQAPRMAAPTQPQQGAPAAAPGAAAREQVLTQQIQQLHRQLREIRQRQRAEAGEE